MTKRKVGEARHPEKRYTGKLVEGQQVGATHFPHSPDTTKVKSGLPHHDHMKPNDGEMLQYMREQVAAHKRKVRYKPEFVKVILANSRITNRVKLWALFAVLVHGMPVEWIADQYGLPRRAFAATVSEFETKCRQAKGKRLSAPLYKILAMAGIEEKFPYVLNVVGKWTVDRTSRVGHVVGFDKKTHRYRVNFNGRIEYLHDDKMVGWSLWDTYEKAVTATSV